MGTPDEHLPHDAPRSAAPAESLDALATPQGVEDRGGLFFSGELCGLVRYWASEQRPYGCRKVVFLNDGVPVGEALFTRRGVSLSLYGGLQGVAAFSRLEALAADGKCSYRAFREVLEPAASPSQGRLSADWLMMESTRLLDEARKAPPISPDGAKE